MAQSTSAGKKALTVMKVHTECDVFKTPKAPVRKKQVVLEEDTYLEEMGKIIQRDFFPDFEKLKAQNEYLDAEAQKDFARMMKIYEKYSSGSRRQTERIPSPATFETPPHPKQNVAEDEVSSHEGAKKKDEGINSTGQNNARMEEKKKLSLDQYLASHTSEDNESFNEFQKEAVVKHRLKYNWLYKDENEINKAIEDKLKVPSIEQQASGQEKPLIVDTWTYKNHNPCMYCPEGVELSDQEKIDLIEKRHEIVHENTRLAENPFDERQNKDVIYELAMNQAKNQEGKIGVDGKIVVCSETAKVKGFSFVMTPSPIPGVNESPLITWGEIEGTPFKLDGSDTPYVSYSGPIFRIPEVSKREKLALALADKANESYRDKKRKAIETARSQLVAQSPNRSNSSIDRLNSMSPAAQKLASSSLGHRLGIHSALRSSCSPSPRRTPSSPYTRPTPRTPKTPLTPSPSLNSNSKAKELVRKSTPNNVTDDLLKLPRIAVRPKASDFF